MLFKPSKNLKDIPGWGNKVLDWLRDRNQLTSAELIELTGLSATDLWVVLEHLDSEGKIELLQDKTCWQLTKQQRIRDRKNASHSD